MTGQVKFLKHENERLSNVIARVTARAEAAKAEVERLRGELEVTQCLLRDAPFGFEDYTYESRYASVSDYPETLDNTHQDTA